MNDLIALPNSLRQFAMQVDEGVFIGLKSLDELDDAEFINHSCSPNLEIRGQITLIAKRKIFVGEEVSFDYQTVDRHPALGSFECRCGSPNCRKVINPGQCV